MQKIIVFGNGVFAEHVYFLLTHDSSYEVVAFTVDQKYLHEERIFDLPVVPFETVENVYPTAGYKMLVSVSFQRINRLREAKYLQAKKKGYELISYIHSRTSSLPGLELGENCMILENVILGPLVKIGNNVTIASGSIIGHHAVIKDHCFISPGVVILGGVTVGEYSLIGANATIKEEVKIARECLIGNNVSITKHTQEKGVYVNPPVKLFPRRSDELRTWLMWPVRKGGKVENHEPEKYTKKDPKDIRKKWFI